MKKETLQELFSNKRRLAVVCECGMSFTGGQGYTALESWQTHVEIYTGNGYPKEEHDTYQVKQNSVGGSAPGVLSDPLPSLKREFHAKRRCAASPFLSGE